MSTLSLSSCGLMVTSRSIDVQLEALIVTADDIVSLSTISSGITIAVATEISRPLSHNSKFASPAEAFAARTE
jgi:hypothetical protein